MDFHEASKSSHWTRVYIVILYWVPSLLSENRKQCV